MGEAAIHPFSFRDLRAPREPAPRGRPAAETYSEADVAAAREDGFAAGFEAASRLAETAEAAALTVIGETIAAQKRVFDDAVEAERLALGDAARRFLKRFAHGLTDAREVELAAGLVDRLMAASGDRAPAALSLNPASLAALRGRLEEALARRGAEGFIELAAAPDLAPGDCRLAWRGGAIERRLADALARLDESFAVLPETAPDTAPDTAPESEPESGPESAPETGTPAPDGDAMVWRRPDTQQGSQEASQQTGPKAPAFDDLAAAFARKPDTTDTENTP